MSNLHRLPNGTAVARNSNGDTMHQCQYCETWFLPKRRFIQKFCSESCRVMACRERKKDMFGLKGGTLREKRNSTTNSELYNQLIDVKERLRNAEDNINERTAVRTDAIRDQLKQVKKYQSWHIFATVTMPIIAPKINKFISGLGKKENTHPPKDLEDFRERFKPAMEKMPAEVQQQLLKAAEMYFAVEQELPIEPFK